MNIRPMVFIFALLILPVFIFAQSNEEQDKEISNVDSAIYYFRKSRVANGIDTPIFIKGEEFMSLMEIDRTSIDRIAAVSKNFKDLYYPLSNEIDEAIILKITTSDSIDLAISYCKNIIHEYDISRNPDERSTALTALLQLRIPLRNKSIPDAFDYYTSRLQVYLAKNDSSGLSVSYFCLGTTYRLTGLPDMSIYNFKKSLSYINKNDKLTQLPISGLRGWINNTSVLGQLYLEIDDYPAAISYSRQARNARLILIRDTNVSFLNCNIAFAKLMLNELDGVDGLLNSAIQLAYEAEDYPSLVRAYEIKGQYFLALNQLDSVEDCILKSKEVMLLKNIGHFSPAGIHTPNYYLARVRILQNRLNDARALMEEEIIKIRNIKKGVLKEQKLLLEIYLKSGDSKAADSLFKEYSDLQQTIYNEERKNRSKSFEVESKIEEAENNIKDLESEKKIASMTKNYLIGIAVLLLIVASVIFNRFRVTKKQKIIIEAEKLRSEELLLNILPSEVADELKAKGRADAKHFDEVTVLFTDFKGFTQLSEKLTPTELISEINECFSAFDHIMQKHGVEKIKTIGDAYMAAGGIPSKNKTHAMDVVNAALDIQEFMHNHNLEKESEGKLFFEIRIGVHTGSVVAGIVGVKKFAYDIWGDTVNIASRIESSSEVGKVNISGSTYELVKDEFRCSYRGKIEAKNKGHIDMYFVDSKVERNEITIT